MTNCGPGYFCLTDNPDYYKFSACSTVGQDVRFYDNSTTGVAHEDAICTIDCLMPHKNAILQLLPFVLGETPQCLGGTSPGQDTCTNMYKEIIQELNPACFVPANSGTYLQAFNWMDRVRIYDITWNSPNLNNVANFGDPDGLYFPDGSPSRYSGSLLDINNPGIHDYVVFFGAFDVINFLYDMYNNCTIATPGNYLGVNNLVKQQNIVEYCRSVYQAAYGTAMVGPTLPLPVTPTTEDQLGSMFEACQYVYNIQGDGNVNPISACPPIDTMCRDSSFLGSWRFGLQLSRTADELIQNLPSHLCQNFLAKPSLPPNPPLDTYYLGMMGPKGLYFAGLGRNPDYYNYLIPTIQPQSAPAYIYRSCALEEYSDTVQNCCANDFADGQGGTIFQIQSGQKPSPPGGNGAPLFGYDYGEQTPWYINCFDSTGEPCDPDHRDITNDICSPIMFDHCNANVAVIPDAVAESWSTSTSGSGECTKWLGRLLYGYLGQWVNFAYAVINRTTLQDRTNTKLTSAVLLGLTQNMSRIFTMQDLYNAGLTPANPLFEPLTPLQQNVERVMFTLYQSYDLTLYDDNLLANQCAAFSIDDVSRNAELRRWCGCLLSVDSYTSRYPGISIACTPVCNSSDVIQFGAVCQGTQCIIDGVTETVINSSGGNLSLVQVCQSCGKNYSSDTTQVKQTCSCIISGVDITVIGSLMGGVNLKEVCGLNGNGGNPVNKGQQPLPQRIKSAARTTVQSFPYPAIGAFLAVAMIALVFYVLSKQSRGRNGTWGRYMRITLMIIALLFVLCIVWGIVSLSRD